MVELLFEESNDIHVIKTTLCIEALLLEKFPKARKSEFRYNVRKKLLYTSLEHGPDSANVHEER